MKQTAKRFLTALCTLAMIFACVSLVTSCSGVKISPDGEGGITITPEEGGNGNGNGNNSGNQEKPNDKPQNPSEIHTHSYTAVESPDNTYSCMKGGVRIWLCSCGDSFRETVTAPGHDIRSFEGKAATCDVDGYESYEKCVRGSCDYTTYKVIPALDHDLKYYADVQPTCTDDGAYDREECIREGCNYSSQKNIAATGHSWERVEGKPATCTSSGYLSYNVCTVLGCDKENVAPTVIEPLGHDNVHYEAKEATCTEFGWNEYDVCQRCGNSTYEKVEAKGHSYVNGYCNCGHSNPGLHEHIWNDGEITQEATCTMPGSKELTCTDANCGDTQVAEIPALGHDNTFCVAKKPTCTEDGYHAYELCERCGYSTYSVDSATGHIYDGGVVTTSSTCTQPGVRTYSCVNDGCNKIVKTEIEKLGHDWGNWFVSVEATCTTSGREQRMCFNDSTHVDYRTIPKLGHAWGPYIVVKNSTCTEEGKEKRTCNNDTSHEEIVTIPCIPHDVVPSTGICNNCKNVIINPLETPVITSFNNYVIFWNAVEGADHYELKVVYNGQKDFKAIDSLSFSLEEYFRECNSLDVFLRAIPPEGSTTPNSNYYMNSYSVEEGSIVDYEGVGKTVNLLTDTYTNYGSGTTSIFNEYMFNRLMAGDRVTLEGRNHYTTYAESISEYTEKLSVNIGGKIGKSASVGIDKIFKVTGGFNFEIDGSYTTKTYNQTQTVFFDAYDVYRAYQGGINGFSDPQVLYSILSDQFVEDAGDLQNGDMTPEEFVNRYGTHVITAGIYGAKFNAHYEMIASKIEIDDAYEVDTEVSITKGIEMLLDGILLGGSNKPGVSMSGEYFISSSDSDIMKRFEINAVGAMPVASDVTTSSFAEISKSWANSMANSNNYVLIDVPDGSLYFIWDFLGDDYAEAKDILNDYFYACCDEQYDTLNSKINGMYKDFFTFDYETGTLTFDLAALQTPGENVTSLKDVLYMDGNTEIFNGTTGKFTIPSKFNEHDVKKVVFEGGYLTRTSRNNELITSIFDGVYIVFTESWTEDRDIVVEFKNFGYRAPVGRTALDFSVVNSKKINIIVTGEVHIEGVIDSNDNGGIGILATGKNITVLGTGNITVIGSKGSNGISGDKSGKNGAVGIIVNNLTVNLNGNLTVNGGNGGNGAIGSPDDVNGEHGGDGGNGGSGAVAIKAEAIVVNYGSVIATGGSGGVGGRGGHGNNKKLAVTGAKDGGDGGEGGNGASAINAATFTAENSSLNITGGSGGNGGRGGNCGKSGRNGDVGSGGKGGTGAIAITVEIVSVNSNIVSVDGTNGSKGKAGS